MSLRLFSFLHSCFNHVGKGGVDVFTVELANLYVSIKSIILIILMQEMSCQVIGLEEKCISSAAW